MKYAYYKSCSLRSSGKDYARSIEAVCKKLDIELVIPKDWVCCGSTVTHHTSRLLSLALPLKNLALVEKMGMDEFVVPCTACYNRFKIAQYEYENDPKLAGDLEDIIGYKFKGKVKVIHPLELLIREPYINRISELAQKDMSSLKIACYYGCLLVRPPKMTQFKDDYEYPVIMDKIINKAGMKTVEWSHKTECCGGSMSLTKPGKVIELSEKILRDAKAVGANAIAVPCTFCQLNLDIRQEDIKKKYGIDYDLPIFYFTELIALAMNIPEKELLLNKHFVDTKKVLAKVTSV